MRPRINRRGGNALRRAFGVNECGEVDLPAKVGGTFVSRLLVGEIMGCGYCFPHGNETYNNRYTQPRRSWKTKRKTQYQPH